MLEAGAHSVGTSGNRMCCFSLELGSIRGELKLVSRGLLPAKMQKLLFWPISHRLYFWLNTCTMLLISHSLPTCLACVLVWWYAAYRQWLVPLSKVLSGCLPNHYNLSYHWAFSFRVTCGECKRSGIVQFKKLLFSLRYICMCNASWKEIIVKIGWPLHSCMDVMEVCLEVYYEASWASFGAGVLSPFILFMSSSLLCIYGTYIGGWEVGCANFALLVCGVTECDLWMWVWPLCDVSAWVLGFLCVVGWTFLVWPFCWTLIMGLSLILVCIFWHTTTTNPQEHMNILWFARLVQLLLGSWTGPKYI